MRRLAITRRTTILGLAVLLLVAGAILLVKPNRPTVRFVDLGQGPGGAANGRLILSPPDERVSERIELSAVSFSGDPLVVRVQSRSAREVRFDCPPGHPAFFGGFDVVASLRGKELGRSRFESMPPFVPGETATHRPDILAKAEQGALTVRGAWPQWHRAIVHLRPLFTDRQSLEHLSEMPMVELSKGVFECRISLAYPEHARLLGCEVVAQRIRLDWVEIPGLELIVERDRMALANPKEQRLRSASGRTVVVPAQCHWIRGRSRWVQLSARLEADGPPIGVSSRARVIEPDLTRLGLEGIHLAIARQGPPKRLLADPFPPSWQPVSLASKPWPQPGRRPIRLKIWLGYGEVVGRHQERIVVPVHSL